MFKVAYSPIYVHPVPENHRFPMEMYGLLKDQLVLEGTVESGNLFEPSEIDESIVLGTHSSEYLHKLKNGRLSKQEERKSGFVHSPQLISREATIMQGTLECTKHAIHHGVSFNIAGGTHHAYRNWGEGFCLLNDFAIASNYLLNEGMSERILIVDLDVHQGNGTASIFADQPAVFTFSMHGESNYPHKKEASDRDIGLEDHTEDSEYLDILYAELPAIVDHFKPDFMFYQCGVDPLKSDKLGRLSLTIEGLKARDSFVLETAKENEVPIVAAMGGGYSEDINLIVEAHANTFRLAQEIFF